MRASGWLGLSGTPIQRTTIHEKNLSTYWGFHVKKIKWNGISGDGECTKTHDTLR